MTSKATPPSARYSARMALALARLALPAVLAMTAGAALACECPNTGVREALEQADAVFAGTVKTVRPVDSPQNREPRVVVDFDVALVWKGKIGRSFTLHTNLAASSCRGLFREWATPGDVLLVYATAGTGRQWRKMDPRYGIRNRSLPVDTELRHIVDEALFNSAGDKQRVYSTNTCSRTKRVIEAVDDFDQLGAFTELAPLSVFPDALRNRLLSPVDNSLPGGCDELRNARLWTPHEPSPEAKRIISLLVDVRLLESTAPPTVPLEYTHHWVIDARKRVGYCRLPKKAGERCGDTQMIFVQDPDGSWRADEGRIGIACSSNGVRFIPPIAPTY